MSEIEQYKQAIKEAGEIINILNRAVIKARDTVPPSISEVMMDLKKNISEMNETQGKHIENELAHWEAMKPVIEAFNDKKGFWRTVATYAKYVGWVSAIIVGMKLIVLMFQDASIIKSLPTKEITK